MLSYRHSYHAGNFADVLKHLCLVEILSYLTQKDKPLCYIDTHSGCAAYDLYAEQADKNKEYLNGIAKLYQQEITHPSIRAYVDKVKQFNQSAHDLTLYPGSPWFAQQILRANDRLFLCELHNQEVQRLKDNMARDKRVKVRHEDGLVFFPSFLPPQEKRGLVLIDPSYEIKSDYQNVVKNIAQAYKKFATGCYALWYPVVDRLQIADLEKRFKQTGIENILLAEISLVEDEQKGMTASGMIIVNPPWILEQNLAEALPELCRLLNARSYRLNYLNKI